MFCQKCGLQLDDSAKFCNGCGVPTSVPSSNVQKAAEKVKSVVKQLPISNMPHTEAELYKYIGSKGVSNPEGLALVYAFSYRTPPWWLYLVLLIPGILFPPLGILALFAASAYYFFRYKRNYYIGMDNQRIVVIQFTLNSGILEFRHDRIRDVVKKASSTKLWIHCKDDSSPKIRIPIYNGNFPNQYANRKKILKIAKSNVAR